MNDPLADLVTAALNAADNQDLDGEMPPTVRELKQAMKDALKPVFYPTPEPTAPQANSGSYGLNSAELTAAAAHGVGATTFNQTNEL